MQIDHDRNEPKIERGPGPWRWLLFAMILAWAWYFYFIPFSWPSIAIGFLTGGLLSLWAIEVTGNKVPDWWRSKPPGSGRS